MILHCSVHCDGASPRRSSARPRAMYAGPYDLYDNKQYTYDGIVSLYTYIYIYREREIIYIHNYTM